jgi:uncharacterized lipoprotein YajG
MKKVLTIVVLSLIAASVANAETLTAKITLSPAIGAQCTSAMGKSAPSIIWNGVSDKRGTSAIGVLTKKNQETEVVPSEPVAKLLDRGLKTMFEKCGYTFASNANANGVKVSADLTEFFAGSKKGLVTGETEAQGMMKLSMVKGGRSIDFEFGGQVHDKGLRKKNVKRIESTLSEVLTMMINDVTSTNKFADAMNELSK